MKNKFQISPEVKEVLVMVGRFLGETQEFYETQARVLTRMRQLLPQPNKDFSYELPEKPIIGTKDRWMTIGQAAAFTYESPSTISRWASGGHIGTNSRMGREKRVLLSDLLLMRYLRDELSKAYTARQELFADKKMTDHDNK